MKVKTLGNMQNPAILMIPGMFCTSDMPEIVGRYLQEDFFLILPTLDGHHKEEPVYHDMQTDGQKIVSWLEDNHISRLAMLQGTSMGAEVALEVAKQLALPVDTYLFDGGPFFHFPQFFRAIMAKKFMMFMAMVKGKDKDQAINDLMQDPFVRRLGGNSLESYRDLMGGFCEVGQWIQRDSVRRISDTCYKCDLPDFPQETVKRFVFLFSENEPARKSEKRLRRRYPNATFLVAKGYGHGGFQGENPEKYADMMRDAIAGRTLRI